MRDLIEQAPSDRDEEIYSAWEGGKKSLRGLARQFGVSVSEIGQAIDRCLPPFNSQTQMRAYKREIQKLEDVGTHYYAKAMEGDLDSGHLYARINERYCAMQGWSSVNVRLDPYQAQTEQKPSQHEQIKDAIMRIAKGPNWRELVDERLRDLPAKTDGNGKGNSAVLAPPIAPENQSTSEQVATPRDRERDTDAT